MTIERPPFIGRFETLRTSTNTSASWPGTKSLTRASAVRSTQRRGYEVSNSSTLSIPYSCSAALRFSPTPFSISTSSPASSRSVISPVIRDSCYSTPNKNGYKGCPPGCTSTSTSGCLSVMYAMISSVACEVARLPVMTVSNSPLPLKS